MATKLAKIGVMASAPHTNGIYSDMTVDGPEIGTLVMVVDRAKNLPNLKKLGKQDPYCAARLGKEAKKTETDKRGGQTPRWDQELRFTVHDSPDYYKIKISVFNDDKKTDVIGEAWVSLENVIVPGGGQSDIWHGLTCKGRYAGEIRLELTYYDTRETSTETTASDKRRHSIHHGAHSAPHGLGLPHGLAGPREHAPVKRRPLPTMATSASAPPIIVPSDPAAAPVPEKAPRSFHTPPQTSAPFSPDDYNAYAQPPPEDVSYGYPVQPPAPSPHGSTHSRRRSIAPQNTQWPVPDARARPQSYMEMPHSHSAPVVPHYHTTPEAGLDRRTQYPPELPPLNGYPQETTPPHQQYAEHEQTQQPFAPYGAAYRNLQPTVEDEDDAAPPPPPVHRASAPTTVPTTHVPEYPAVASRVPPAYAHPAQDSFAPQPTDRRYSLPPPRDNDPFAIPATLIPGSSPARAAHRHRMSMSACPPSLPPYPTSDGARYPADYQTPPRHLVQGQPPEYVTPPNPPYAQPLSHGEPAPTYYATASPDAVPIVKPRPVSPNVGPVDARQSRITNRSTPTRKSVSPRPQTSDGTNRAPFSPDSFDTFNPAARSSAHNLHGSNPHSPYSAERTPATTRPTTATSNQTRDMDIHARDENGNIVTQDGRTIDPSDHLPVDSWAPEPEPKGKDRDKRTPLRERERLTGARELGSRYSDRTIRDAVTGTFGLSNGFDTSPSAHIHSAHSARMAKRHSQPAITPIPLASSGGPYGGGAGLYGGLGAPPIPAKVPLTDGLGAEDLGALSEEMKGIDLGPTTKPAGRARWKIRLGRA